MATRVKSLQDAVETLDAEIADLTERAVATGIGLFTSVEEVDSPEWWRARKLFIELATARAIRSSLGFDEAPEPQKAEPAAEGKGGKRKRGS